VHEHLDGSLQRESSTRGHNITKNLAYTAGSRQGQALSPRTRIGARAQLTDPVRLKRLVEYDDHEDRGWETCLM
jgi:hypothetical protein